MEIKDRELIQEEMLKDRFAVRPFGLRPLCQTICTCGAALSDRLAALRAMQDCQTKDEKTKCRRLILQVLSLTARPGEARRSDLTVKAQPQTV